MCTFGIFRIFQRKIEGGYHGSALKAALFIFQWISPLFGGGRGSICFHQGRFACYLYISGSIQFPVLEQELCHKWGFPR